VLLSDRSQNAVHACDADIATTAERMAAAGGDVAVPFDRRRCHGKRHLFCLIATTRHVWWRHAMYTALRRRSKGARMRVSAATANAPFDRRRPPCYTRDSGGDT